MKLITLMYFILIPSLSLAGEINTERARGQYCNSLLNKIQKTASDIQSADSKRRSATSDALDEKNAELRKEKLSTADQSHADSIAGTGYLSDLLTIYKDSLCDMDKALIHMFCPDSTDKKCNWVYQQDKK
jgi:hypothetical protein